MEGKYFDYDVAFGYSRHREYARYITFDGLGIGFGHTLPDFFRRVVGDGHLDHFHRGFTHKNFFRRRL